MLKSDLAGEFPLYLCWSEDKTTLFYSKSITMLLDDTLMPKPLKFSEEGISLLSQSGMVRPPKTAYLDIHTIAIGDKAQVRTQNGKVQVSFNHQFSFISAYRLQRMKI